MADSKHTPTLGYVRQEQEDGEIEYALWGSDHALVCEISDWNFPEAKAWVDRICNAVNERDDLIKALGWFLDDERFQVGVGGNPNATEKMLAEARAIYARAQVRP